MLAQFDGLPPRRYLALSACTAAICVAVIALCQSRAGLAAFLLAALAYEILRGQVGRVAVPLLAVAACSLLFHFWHPVLTPSTHTPFVPPANLVIGPRAPGQSKLSALLSGRDEVWLATTHLIGKQPFAGYGFGTGDQLLKASQFKHFAGFSPHNAYLQIVLELGVLGALLLLAPLALGLGRVVGGMRVRASPPDVAAFGAVLVGGLLAGIFEDVFEAAGSPFAPLIWLSCAVVLVRVRQRAASPALETVTHAVEPVATGAYHPSR